MVVKDALVGKETLSSEVQYRNACEPRLVSEDGRSKDSSDLQFVKALLPMEVHPPSKVTVSRARQLSNILAGTAMLLSKVASCREAQSWKM